MYSALSHYAALEISVAQLSCDYLGGKKTAEFCKQNLGSGKKVNN